MDESIEPADGLLRRSDIEIELAHLVLRLSRRVDTDGDDAEARQRLVTWFDGAADELVQRTSAADQPFVEQRLEQIGKTIAGIDSRSNDEAGVRPG